MAHIQRAIANGHRPNGSPHGEFEAPPSTQAAQLINNISTGNKPSRPAERDDLQRLMAEIAQAENQAAENGSSDVKIQHAHKLIYVFALTVLERLATDDPFMNIPQIVSQTSEALDIFMTAIKETPAVLDYVLQPDEVLRSRGQEPVWVWLFPKVLVLLGRKGCETLTEKIKDFFFISFQVVARSPRLWNLSFLFFSYLKDCVSILLGNLQNPAVISSNAHLDVILPSRELELLILSENEDHPMDTDSHCTYQIRDPSEGLYHVTNILAVLVDISTEAARSYDAISVFQDYLAWMLDSILNVHELHKRRRETSQLPQFNNQLEELSFGTVHAFLGTVKHSMTSIVLHKTYVLLAVLCADLISRPNELSDDTIRVTLCSALLSLSNVCKDDESMYRLVSFHISTSIVAALENETACMLLGDDFKKAAVSFCGACQIGVPEIITGNVSESFQSEILNTEFNRLDLRNEKSDEALGIIEPPHKRRKMFKTNTTLERVVSALYSTLGHQEATDLYGLHQIAEESFSSLDDADRSKVITYLGILPCAIRGTLDISVAHPLEIQTAVCSICQSPSNVGSDVVLDGATTNLMSEAILVFENLTKSPQFISSRRTRVRAMFVLRNFAHHFDAPAFLDLNTSLLGQWCMRSLNSTLRELRIAASRTLPIFVKDNIKAKDIVASNRVSVMNLLRGISQKGATYLQETCVLTWTQLGRVLDDGSLVYVLLELVKYLGHSNPVVSSVTFNEISALSKARKTTVKAIFSPFWDTLAYQAVRDYVSKPQTTQQMAELFNMTVDEFLVFTQSFSLPYLVLNKDYEVIKRISRARSDSLKWMVCFDPSNLVKILALLLQQNVPDIEQFIMALLVGFDPKFKENDLTDLMKIEPSTTAFYLLLAAGDADAKLKSRVRFALETIARKAPSSEGSQKRKNDIGLFLEQHILGLANRFIESIMAISPELSMMERERSVKGIEELVRVATSYSRVARPHLCSCLQSAIAIKPLEFVALSAWNAMLKNLEDDDVEAMLESTFSLVLQHWTSFDKKTQDLACATLEYLLKDRKKLIRRSIVNIPSLSQFEELAEINRELHKLRTPTDPSNALHIFSRRLGNENSSVIYQALIELKVFLGAHQSFLQASAVSEQPDLVIGLLVRSILDICVKFNKTHSKIAQLSAECIGLIGCLDPNRVESVRERREMILVSNFQEVGESTDFVLFTLQEVLVPAFLSTTDTSLQGFFSFSMQRLLEVVDFRTVCGPIVRSGQRNSEEPLYLKWMSLPSSIQDTLTPFLSSRYILADLNKPRVEYPIFDRLVKRNERNEAADKLYGPWLRTLVSDLLSKPFTLHANVIFSALSRAIRIRDTTVARFLLPYLVVHTFLEGSEQNRRELKEELLSVLKFELPEDAKSARREELKSCLETVFHILDYLSRWVQERQLKINQSRGLSKWEDEVKLVKSITSSIPAEMLSQRAIECKSYSRALFYWEQHIRNERSKNITEEKDHRLLQRMQEIYAQIDEPDGIEGISAQLHVLDIEQQIIGHQKAGRWTAAQAWYEIKLAEKPNDAEIQVNLLNCLKESGQHDVLLNYVEGMKTATPNIYKLLPFATEASWATGRWDVLEKYASMAPKESGEDFNIRIGQALLALHKDKGETIQFKPIISSMREKIACSLSEPMTSSLAACHDTMLKLHVLTELEMIAGTNGLGADHTNVDRTKIIESLDRRLEVIGAYLNDKQYLLGIRRAAMNLSNLQFENEDIAEAWLTSARLARKGNAIHQSFNAVLHASQLGNDSATIEHARLIWKEGNHRKAIGILEGAIKTNAFISHNKSFQGTTVATGVGTEEVQNLLKARAHLMLAKWQDAAGQINSNALRAQYANAVRTQNNWEKGHYYLGRHYNKLLQTEELLPADQQKDNFVVGEAAKIIIENYFRSLVHGTKYIYQTLPRIITLWLDLGTQINQPIDPKFGNGKDYAAKINERRKQSLEAIHVKFVKYIGKLPAYMFYTAFPQILSRISHTNQDVIKQLQAIIVKVVMAYPQHTLWNVLAVCTSNQPDRKTRGMTVLQAVQKKADRKADCDVDIKALIRSGTKMTAQLLSACNNGDFPNNRNSKAHIVRDLNFDKSCTPSLLVVPFESILKATLPTLTDDVRSHKAFSSDIITIDSFQDEVLILSSLQKPRKLTAIGSDGRAYGILCKPKDDLRKDQRLMEFNSMINRALKRDAEASRRQLYIKTYAVTPLNEECGIIEWVDGLKTFRDILLALYKTMGIQPQYKEIEYWCEKHMQADPKDNNIFAEKVIKNYPPVFHKWFVQQFPEPSAWFAARIRYTRSCAVMSMVGTILGLGDRHGENILYEEGNGGTFHVDFNCLFDKGLTFTKPERVPFRLTHNMVDAMGMYNFEGPFRKSSEITLQLLRQHEETLMTILEAFVHDPTLDLLNKKPEKKRKEGIPQTAQGVLDSIQRKVKGYMAGETVPLGVEGQVDELIGQATNHLYLAGMYIGWCSFL